MEKFIPAEKISEKVKRAILECISKSAIVSPNLKKFATDTLKVPYNELIHLSTFAKNEIDAVVIRKCRENAS